MVAGSRRLTTRLALALLWIGMALSFGLADVQAAAAANPVSIKAHVGYSDVVKLQQWMPVSIVITNNGPQIDGTLEIVGMFGASRVPWPASYQRSIVLAGGATKFVRVYFVEESAGLTVTVRIVRNGRTLAAQNAAFARVAGTLVGVLSDDSTALDDFALVRPGGIAVEVVHLGVADLVDSPIALHGFDLLAVDDFATNSLSLSQQAAIADYVKTGGSLLVGTGASWRRTLSGLPADILPVRVSGLATLGPSRALGGLEGVQVAAGSLTGGTALLADGDQPLLAERTVGTGSVTVAMFDWKQDPIPTWSGTFPLLRRVLVQATFGATKQQGSVSPLSGPMRGSFNGLGTSTFDRSDTLSQVLGNLPALDLPSLALTGALVLSYVLLVGPVNYFVLGILRRRALAWITLPLIAVLVAAGAYGGAILTKGQSVQMNQLSIVHLAPPSDSAYQETYTGVVTPTRGDYLVGTGGQPLLAGPVSQNNGFGGSSRSDIRVDVEDGTIILPGMTAFTLRGYSTEGMIAAPRLVGQLHLVNGVITGSIENRSSTTFSDAVVVAGESYQKLGLLAPGATAPISFSPAVASLNGGPPSILGMYPNYSFPPSSGAPTDNRRTGETKTRVISMLLNGAGSFKGIASSSVAPLVVAWTSQSFQPVTVNGVHPRGQSLTAVAMSLPIDQVGVGPLPAGIISGQIVDVEGDILLGQGVPGALVVQNGTVTFRFTPPLAAGHRLTRAGLSSGNPFISRPPPATAMAVSTVKGEAWSWSRSAWVDIAYADGTTALPEAVIEPASGEIRLRITVSGGGFLPTAMSLTGTVE